MGVTKVFSSVLLSLVLAASAEAIVVDFEDLSSAASYSAGNMFVSNGIQFDVIAYNGPGFTLNVDEMASTNTFLNMGNSIGVSVALPAPVNYLSFDYADFCGGCEDTGITVNGAASSPSAELTSLHGTSLGGVQITLQSTSIPTWTGRLVLEGPISSFSLGGTEFLVDNLTLIPEPTTLPLAAGGLVGGFFLWRRRKRGTL